MSRYNLKSPAVKRLMREASEMHEPTEDYSAAPINDNLFEWHFTIRGASDTEFEGGLYHGRIMFESEYPMKPPNIVLLTPNGRFEINKKICLSISAHHPETWQPSWCVRTALLALIAFMPTPGNGTVGSLDYPKEERQSLALKSKTWECSECGKVCNLLRAKSENPQSDSQPGKTEKTNNESIVSSLPNSEEYSNSPAEDSSNFCELSRVSADLLDTATSNVEVNTDESPARREEAKNTPEVGTVPLTLNSTLFSQILSNVSNSKITISIIMLLIAVLLYRRLFLLGYK